MSSEQRVMSAVRYPLFTPHYPLLPICSSIFLVDPFQLGLQLLRRRERGAYVLRKKVVFGYAHGLIHATQWKLHRDPIALLAENQADGRLVVRMPELLIDDVEVEVHLASKLGLEGFDLQIDHDVGTEDGVVEEKVEIVVLAADFHVVLASHEGESLAEFKKELPQMIEKRPLQLVLADVVGESEEVEMVGILHQLARQIGLGRGQCAVKIGECLPLTTAEVGFDPMDQDSATSRVRSFALRTKSAAEGL